MEGSRRQKDAVVQKVDTPAMFSEIAARYDLLNHALSLNIDRLWRGHLVRMSDLPPGARVLDACTGTGDVAIGFATLSDPSEIVGVDLSPEMLKIGRRKTLRRELDGQIAFDGSPRDLFASPEVLAEAALEPPPVFQLGTDCLGRGVLTVEELCAALDVEGGRNGQ